MYKYPLIFLVILFSSCGHKRATMQIEDMKKKGWELIYTLEKQICATSLLLDKAKEYQNEPLTQHLSEVLADRVHEYHLLNNVNHNKDDFPAVLLTAAYVNYCYYNRNNQQ